MGVDVGDRPRVHTPACNPPCSSGGTGRSDPALPVAALSRGDPASKDSPAAARVCKQLAAEGIGMLRFDNLGLGESSGNWGDGSFTVKVADTVRAAEFLGNRGLRVDMLVGHSFGSAPAAPAPRRSASVSAAPTRPGHPHAAPTPAPDDSLHSTSRSPCFSSVP
jgi:putative redox protein